MSKEVISDDFMNKNIDRIIKKNKKDKIGHVSPSFYVTLSGYDGFKSVSNLKIVKDLKSKKFDNLFIPIHFSSHWILINIAVTSKTIKIYDSLNGQHPIISEKFINFLNYIGMKNFKIQYVNCPKQKNISDAGILVLEFVRCIVENENVSNIKVSNIAQIKQRLVK